MKNKMKMSVVYRQRPSGKTIPGLFNAMFETDRFETNGVKVFSDEIITQVTDDFFKARDAVARYFNQHGSAVQGTEPLPSQERDRTEIVAVFCENRSKALWGQE